MAHICTYIITTVRIIEGVNHCDAVRVLSSISICKVEKLPRWSSTHVPHQHVGASCMTHKQAWNLKNASLVMSNI